jgi:hypothetical protein
MRVISEAKRKSKAEKLMHRPIQGETRTNLFLQLLLHPRPLQRIKQQQIKDKFKNNGRRRRKNGEQNKPSSPFDFFLLFSFFSFCFFFLDFFSSWFADCWYASAPSKRISGRKRADRSSASKKISKKRSQKELTWVSKSIQSWRAM